MKETEYEKRLKSLEDTLAKYEKKSKLAEDIQAIKDLHREYVYWVADCQWDKVIDCFTDDCSVNISKWGLRRGKDALQKLFKEDIGHINMGQGRDGHFVTMPVIEVKDDQASGHWAMYVMISEAVTGKAERWFAGRHDVEYRRVKGNWKIRKIVYTAPWPRQTWSVPKLEDLED
jgi:ketosteroid isomerase-like protein